MTAKSFAALSFLLLVSVTLTRAGRESSSEESSSKKSTSKNKDCCSTECQGMQEQLATMSSDIQSVIKAQRCPWQFLYDHGADICLQITYTRSTWSQAQESCEYKGTGGRLAVLDTEKKFEFALLSFKEKNLNGPAWVGARLQDGQWVWATGQAVTGPWAAGHPDGNGECLSINTSLEFENLPCGQVLFFYCEIPVV